MRKAVYILSFADKNRMARLMLSDDQYEWNAPLLPGKPTNSGRTEGDNRLSVEAVLWIACTGSPAAFGIGRHSSCHPSRANRLEQSPWVNTCIALEIWSNGFFVASKNSVVWLFATTNCPNDLIIHYALRCFHLDLLFINMP